MVESRTTAVGEADAVSGPSFTVGQLAAMRPILSHSAKFAASLKLAIRLGESRYVGYCVVDRARQRSCESRQEMPPGPVPDVLLGTWKACRVLDDHRENVAPFVTLTD